MRMELPIEISNQMKLWRLGLNSLPQSYIEFHKGLAEKELQKMKEDGVIIHNQYMHSDGWMDGMKVLYAIIEKRNKLMKISWNDGNQEFFLHSENGGSFPLRLE